MESKKPKGLRIEDLEVKFSQDAYDSEDIVETLTVQAMTEGGGAFVQISTTKWTSDLPELKWLAEHVEKMTKEMDQENGELGEQK